MILSRNSKLLEIRTSLSQFVRFVFEEVLWKRVGVDRYRTLVAELNVRKCLATGLFAICAWFLWAQSQHARFPIMHEKLSLYGALPLLVPLSLIAVSILLWRGSRWGFLFSGIFVLVVVLLTFGELFTHQFADHKLVAFEIARFWVLTMLTAWGYVQSAYALFRRFKSPIDSDPRMISLISADSSPL